ncbi:MAG: STN domain-containing protein, partial [Alphaproteobacteria bacterium]
MARYALLTGASLLALALATPAGAAPESLQVSTGTEKTIEKAQADDLFTFKISSKPLPQAIAEFSAVTGLQVLYTEPAVFERTAPALVGDFTARDALTQLLAGSGLIGRYTS